MIQDIAPHHFDNAYHSYAPREEDFVIYCQPHQVLLKRQEDRIIFPTFQDLKKRNDDILENATYLFQIDEFRFFLVKHVNPEPLSGFQMENTEIFRLAEPSNESCALINSTSISPSFLCSYHSVDYIIIQYRYTVKQ